MVLPSGKFIKIKNFCRFLIRTIFCIIEGGYPLFLKHHPKKCTVPSTSTSCVVLNVFLGLLCIFKWSKLGSYLHNTNIWGHFWSKFGNLTPRGDHIYEYPHCFAINFEEISTCFVLNVFLWFFCS